MTAISLVELQHTILTEQSFASLNAFAQVCEAFLTYITETGLTRIVSPRTPNYIFYQYPADNDYKITRPLNTNLFIESPLTFVQAYEGFMGFLHDLRKFQGQSASKQIIQSYIIAGAVNKVVYTLQQTVGCIGDSLVNANQARKRIGQSFETLIKHIMREVGVACEGRTVKLPVPGYSGYTMSYELDIVFSRDKALITSETQTIHPSEIVGSVKTTSKDRIDKIFLDKYLLTNLVGRDVPVVAIFLHDVQRASVSAKSKPALGATDFAITSTFKTGHFLGYSVALTRLDGVYYVDPRPEMQSNEKLREHIKDFQQFLLTDMWLLFQRP